MVAAGQEILRVNPLARRFPETREVLREERDKALRDSRLVPAFKSFRLNLPSGDESTMLLTLDDWDRVTVRGPWPSAEGRPIIGIDLGGWPRMVAPLLPCGRSGRAECDGVVPQAFRRMAEQEKSVTVYPADTYQALAATWAPSTLPKV